MFLDPFGLRLFCGEEWILLEGVSQSVISCVVFGAEKIYTAFLYKRVVENVVKH